MFVFLSKTFDAVASPLFWTLLFLACSLALRRRAPRAATSLLVAGGAVLWAFSTGLVADALEHALERPALRTTRPGVTYDAVVVLTGVVDVRAARASGQLELNEAAERIVAAFELARAGRARKVLISGGPTFPRPGQPREAEQLRDALVRWGLEPDRVVVEGESRNTRESALASARVVEAHGWRSLVLVTSAYHLPRALGCFRKAGLSPDAFPVDHRAGSPPSRGWLPSVPALESSTTSLHEALGRLVYRVMGYT